MPYSLFKKGGKFCVKNSETGENKGCSETKDMATKHMRALYAAEAGDKMGKKEIDMIVSAAVELFDKQQEEDTQLEEKEQKYYGDDVGYAPFYGATSYAEVDATREAEEKVAEIDQLVYMFPRLAGNILKDDEVTDKETAINKLASELTTRVSDLRKERESSEEDVDGGVLKATWDHILKGIQQLLPTKETPERSEEESDESPHFVVWHNKETNEPHWLARYSNNFRDQDLIPEIISADSHRRFVDLVDKGLAPYPELWLWHVPEWKIGEATWLAYDDTGFALAAGTFTKGCEQVAEWLKEQQDFRVSHGMPPHTIKRDGADNTIIIEHESRELSPLPRIAAANELTGFVVINKEAVMAIPDAKKQDLIKNYDMPPEFLAKVEALNASSEKEAEDAGLERKEVEEEGTETEATTETTATTTEEATETEESTETTEEAGETEPTTEATEETKEAPEDEEEETKEEEIVVPTAFKKEVADAMATVLVPMVEKLDALSELPDQVKAIEDRMTTLEKQEADTEERVTKTLEGTPMASLSALLSNRVVGSEDAQIDGRESLAKSKPAAPEKEDGKEKVTGNPIVDGVLAFATEQKPSVSE